MGKMMLDAGLSFQMILMGMLGFIVLAWCLAQGVLHTTRQADSEKS